LFKEDVIIIIIIITTGDVQHLPTKIGDNNISIYEGGDRDTGDGGRDWRA
jgi:hypothetical protein